MDNSKILDCNTRATVRGRGYMEDPQSCGAEKVRDSEDKDTGNDKRCSRVARRWTSASLRLRRLRS